MQILLRRFEKKDIKDKVKWINDSQNNKYLHYDLPLEVEKTEAWYEKNKDRTDRLDMVIETEDGPVGLIGFLNIDLRNLKAECYICIGEQNAKGKGIAKKASLMLLEHAFKKLLLNKIYFYTEKDNLPAQALFEKIGFLKEGFLKDDLIYNGRKVDRFLYGITKKEYEAKYCD
ncbi:MAG: GNAT family N-acetyltransferase [Clostridia bacterium]|nr:GNAT family N-acetyltransferase [Clostridia bacterium]